MDIPDDLVLGAASLGLAVAVYLHARQLLNAWSNRRALRERGFQQRRLLPWMPLSKLVWRFSNEMAIVFEYHHSTGDNGVFEYTRIGFFGCHCVPTGVWASAAEFAELAGFSIRRGGYMLTMESREDAMSGSRAFPMRLEKWAAEFSAVMTRAASLPRDIVCGACGLLVDAERPEQRARCSCRAVYHLKCAEFLDGECVRWDCPSHAGTDEPNRLNGILGLSLPR